MRLNDLLKFGIPQSVIEAWKSRQGEYLLPLQEHAVRSGLLSNDTGGRGENLLISAPTSSGKSFCGEMAAIETLVKRRRAVMLVPLKSMAEEKYHYFKKCYAALGISVLIVTGDHPENDIAFQRGKFDLAIAIYEKFNRLLTVNLDILRQIGLIIVDEIQMISEPERGPELELALAKILKAGYDPRIVALSAVLDDGHELAEWLGGRIVTETVRPVDLLLGVVVDGSFRYRSFNSGFEGHEKINLGSGEDAAESLIGFLKSGERQKLVFLKSRRDTVEAARKLAVAVKWPEAKKTLAALDDEEPSCLVRSLRRVLSRGVAFHNADLTAGQRLAIENGYRDGEIGVIFSTTTLAMGVNLPAETVLLETVKYSSGVYGTRPAMVPISAAEFQNISGRAGRFGLKPERSPGRAVVVAGSDFESDVLWTEYIDSKRGEKPHSALSPEYFPDVVLDLIACGFGRDRESLEKSLSGLLYDGGINGEELSGIIDRLVEDGFVRRSLEPTPAGRATAESGIMTVSARKYRQYLAARYPASDIGWLFLALSVPDFDISLGCLDRREYTARLYEKMLYQRYDEYMGEIDAFSDLSIGREPLDHKTMSILKAVLLLSEWAGGTAVDHLEQCYQLCHGQIIRLAETAAWLVAAVGRLVKAADCRSSIPARLDELAFRVQFGIDTAMRDLHHKIGSRLHRGHYRQLHDNDLVTAGEILKAGREHLGSVLESAGAAERLIDMIEKSMQQEDKMNKSRNNHGIEAGFNPAIIELDGGYEKERYLVKIDGFPVRLTGKSFKYLAKLAFSRLINREGWVYKDDIEAGFNQARYLYRLKQELKAGGVPCSIFENNRLGYYRLSMEPSKIRVNLDNFKNHYDFELREIADKLALRMVS